jgi:hypothetical protein
LGGKGSEKGARPSSTGDRELEEPKLVGEFQIKRESDETLSTYSGEDQE